MTIYFNRILIFTPAIMLLAGVSLLNAQIDTLAFSSKDKIYKDSEVIFENFGRLGITASANWLQWTNTTNQSIGYEVGSDLSPSAGVVYNFYQTGRFNFRAGAFVRYFNVVEGESYSAQVLGLSRDVTFESVTSPEWSYHLPIEVEFNRFLAKDFAFSASVGYEWMYYDSGLLNNAEFQSTAINNIPVVFASEFDAGKKITGGVNFSAGFYFKAGSTLIRANAKYHLHLSQNSIKALRIRTANLTVPPDISGHQWRGHYWSFDLTIHPRNWFRKKKD
jgi:hypothetical protein